MPLSTIGVSGLDTSPSSSTVYIPVISALEGYSSEVTTQIEFPVAGKLKKLRVQVNTNASSGTNSSITVRKNGVDTALAATLTVGASNFIFQDYTDEVSVAAGDLINYKFVTGSSGASIELISISMLFLPDDPDITITPIGGNIVTTVPSLNASTSRFNTPVGRLIDANSNITGLSFPLFNDGIIQNFGLYSNTGGRSLSQRVFKNEVDDGVNRANLAQDVTGMAKDNSSSISVVGSDKVAFRLTWGASGTTRNIYNQWAWFKTTTKHSPIIIGATAGGAFTSNITRYIMGVPGYMLLAGSEDDVSYDARADFTYDKLGVLVSSNTLNSGNTTVRFRKNGANGNQFVQFSAGQVGFFQDVTHSDSVTIGDLVNLSVVNTGSSGTVTITAFGMAQHDDTNYSILMTNLSTKTFANKFITKV